MAAVLLPFAVIAGIVVAVVYAIDSMKAEPITEETLKIETQINKLEKGREELELMLIRTSMNCGPRKNPRPHYRNLCVLKESWIGHPHLL